MPAGAARQRDGVLSAADCLNARAELAVEIARVRERDANGHVAHALVATLAIFLQPIANAPANIGFGLLVAMCALRVHRLWRVWALMFRDWFWLLLVAWALWTGITLAWSEDVAYGFRQWTAFRAILWVPMLWPVIDRWRWLVGALLAGVAVGNALQVIQFATGWPKPRPGKGAGGGFHMYSYMGAWAAVAFAVWMVRAVMSSWLTAIGAVLMATLASAGVVLSGTRGVVLAVAVEVVVLSVLLVMARPRWIGMAVSRTIVGITILSALWLTLGRVVEARFMELAKNSQNAMAELDARMASSDGDPSSPPMIGGTPDEVIRLVLAADPYRGSIWVYSVRQWAQNPLTGTGIGTVLHRAKMAAAAGRSEYGLLPKHLNIGHPHSTWLQALSEGGLVGLSLLVGWVLAGCVRGWKLIRSPLVPTGSRQEAVTAAPWLAPGMLGALIAFVVASQFDCYHLNATAFALGLIPATLLAGLDLRRELAAGS